MLKKRPHPAAFRRLLTVAGAVVTTGLAAQTAPTSSGAAAAPAGPASADEEIVVLSPFEVSASNDTGYVATETLAGTRIRTDLRDVGSAISVVTKEFMNDIGATGSATLLQYTTNAEVAGTRGTYAGMGNGQTLYEGFSLSGNQRIRGLDSADNTRDYFVTDIPWDSFNVDRIDIQRGPNSILFGLGSPAGIVNASTRNASFRNAGSVEARVGSYGSTRASLGYNQALIDNVLALRVDGLWSNEKFQQKQAFQKDKRIAGAARWDPKFFGKDFATSFKVKAEKGEITANRPRTSTPYDSITPWFTSTADGGAGGITVDNVYALGANASTTSPWLQSISGQQTPTYFIDGANGQVYSINSGYINNGFRKDDGTLRGPGDNAVGQRYSEVIFGLGGYKDYAFNAKLPYYTYAQYKNKMLADPSVFDFYNTLIDGDNKGETADWTTYNVALSQMGWGDRVGVELTYDYQKYNSGGWSLLGGAPTINVDVTKEMQDGTANTNYGRAFVSSSSGGTGNSSVTKRENLRASLFAEFRASDFIGNKFLVKLIGKHRFNGVASKETYNNESLAWNRYANDNGWDAFTTRTTGYSNLFTYRTPVSLVYLTPKLASATGAHIPGIASDIRLDDGTVYLFDSTWTATGVNPTDAWTVPAGNAYLNKAFNPTLVTKQASNPANYKGWGTSTPLNTLSFEEGAPLYTDASKKEVVTTSYAGTWQGYLWNESIVPTLGWRFDTVKQRTRKASPDGANKGYLKLDQANYSLPDFPANALFKGHSLSGGIVVHLNKALPKRWDVLPFNVSLSYNDSSNFRATSARVDLYGNAVPNQTGDTKDYGITLSTKDNRFSLRALKYESTVLNKTLSTDSGFSGTIVQGLKFRNVFLYEMTGYTEDTIRKFGDPGNTFNNRSYWSQSHVDANGRPVLTINYLNDPGQYGSSVPATAVKLQTLEEAAAHRDASIRAWNEIQGWLDDRGYFQAWNYTPTTRSALTDRSTYASSINPATNRPTNAQYIPDWTTVKNYGGSAPSGYAITADAMSEGYEFELTANITKNWRLAFNASKTSAVNTNIGGGALQELVEYMDGKMAGVAGDMRQYNGDYVANNELRKRWADWRGGYTLLKLQENTDASELRKWRYNVITNYSFTDGVLKGAGLGGAYRWQDKVVIGYPVYNDANGFAAYDLSKPRFGPSEGGMDLWMSYERKLTAKVNWKIQLNIRNAFEKEGLIPITVEPDGSTWAGVRMKPVQEWSVTNTFSF